jgi:hypothetical protein
MGSVLWFCSFVDFQKHHPYNILEKKHLFFFFVPRRLFFSKSTKPQNHKTIEMKLMVNSKETYGVGILGMGSDIDLYL